MTLYAQMSEIQSAVALLVLVIGLGLIVPGVLDRRRTLHRAIMLGGAAVLALRYIWWRATETVAPLELSWDWAASWSLLALEGATMVGSLSAYLLLTRRRSRTLEADRQSRWWAPGPAPKAAVLIATYNEDWEVLERTITGAVALDYPAFEVLVLDDGRRDWLRERCAERGVGYLRRPDNKGSKAGNINHALGHLAASGRAPEFVAVLDADFVPHRKFLARTLALFADRGVGLVQTPQHFFNADPIQHNLNLSRSYPDEQRFFFDHLQPARDGWDIAMCCGTSSVLRWEAIQELGGLPTESVTEDFLLTLALQERGWSTAYLNEALSEGLAPEGLAEYVTQRARWCLGLMQIVRSRYGPLGDGLRRWRDRWSVTDALVYWATTFVFRLGAIVYPLLYWYFGITAVDARVAEVISYFGPYYLWAIFSMNFIARNTVIPLLIDVSQLLAAAPISRAVFVGLFRPKGHKFSVTAKGGDRGRVVVQWRLMMPFVVLLALTVVGLWLGIIFDRFAHFEAGSGKIVILFWSFYNVLLLSLTILTCIELPRRERHVMDVPERAMLRIGGHRPHHVWLASLTRDVARVRGLRYAPGELGVLSIDGIGAVPVTVLSVTDEGARLKITPTDSQNEALIRRFHTSGQPGVHEARLAAMAEAIARRLSFNA